jgi:signal transduction histidine kinase
LVIVLAVSTRPTPGDFELRYFFSTTHGESFDTALTWWWIATGVILLAVLARRRWPVPAYLAALAAAGWHAHQALLPPLPVDYGVLVCLFTVADRCRRAVSVPLALGGIATAVLAEPTSAASPVPEWRGVALASAVLLLVAWTAGDSTRTHRAYLGEVRARAEEADRERALHTELAVAAERERIARELHDVVAHGLSVMIIQAQGARAALEDDLDQARQALGSILDTGRRALADMRRLVRIAREQRDGRSDLAPVPSVDQLPALIEQVRGSGLPVSLGLTGDAICLDPAIDLSVFRIVQEALTNVLKHAGSSATARVEITYGSDTVDICVTDTGSAERSHHLQNGESAGNGLVGMKERARLLGGRLDAGPFERGGFRVHARLPASDTTSVAGR